MCPRAEKIMKTIATSFAIIGALLLSFNVGMNVLAYVLMSISSYLWSAYAKSIKEKELLIMNLVFLTINIIGIFRYQ